MSHAHPSSVPPDPLAPLAHDVVGVVAGVLLGGLALHVAAVAAYHDAGATPTADRAVVTSLLGAAVWSLLASVPSVGLLLALAGWLALVHLRYPGSIGRTGVVAAVAVAGATVVTVALTAVDASTVPVLGVPAL